MTIKNRVVTKYYMELNLYKGRRIPYNNILLKDELKKVLEYILTVDINLRKYNDKMGNKIYFLDKFNENNNLFNLVFKSAKYNHVRNVIDTNTLENKGKLKEKSDGDEEKTHFSILINEDNCAICLLENNYYGISMSKIEFYINSKIAEYYNSMKMSKFYKVETSIIPNKNFITALSEMSLISMVSLIIDKNDLDGSDFLNMSNLDDIRDEIQITAKRTKERSINIKTIKNYYNDKEKNKKIKRILVKGKINNSPVQLDTEKMKTKNEIRVETEIDTNEVKSESIFKEFKKILLGDEGSEA